MSEKRTVEKGQTVAYYARPGQPTVNGKVLQVLSPDNAKSTLLLHTHAGDVVAPYAPSQTGGWGWPESEPPEPRPAPEPTPTKNADNRTVALTLTQEHRKADKSGELNK